MKNGYSPDQVIQFLSRTITPASLILSLVVISCTSSFAQNQTAKVTTNDIWYYEYLPPDYNLNTNNYPIVFFLHGMGEKGDTEASLVNVAKAGPPKHVKSGYKFPFILISPQLKTKYSGWPNLYIDQLIEHCKSYLRIDPARVYLTGLSLGGGGVWQYAQEPLWGEKFAAIAPICGSGNTPAKACSFGATNLPVWAFHGDKDPTVNISKSIAMVDAINKCNPAPNPLAKLTVYPGVGHNSWDNAYRTDNSLHTPNLYQWLLGFKNQGLFVYAGGDYYVNLPTNSTTIKGIASTDAGTITSYAWTQISGPAAVITNASSPNVSLTGMTSGSYVMRLTVETSTGQTTYDEIKVRCVSGNAPPVANAGADVTITLPTNSVNLVGSGTDANGTIASYAWVQTAGPAATMAGSTTSTLALTNLVQGTYSFSLTVTDNGAATATDLVTVIVMPAATNQLPTANAGADKTVNLPTASTTLTGSGSDPDGTIASYLWEKVTGPSVGMANTTTTTLSLSALVTGVYTFRLTVTDNSGGKKSDDVNVTVVAANQNPVAQAGSDITITLPTNSTNLAGSGTDPDGSISSYLWTYQSGPGAPPMTNGTTPTPTVTALVQGTYVFRLTVTDDKGASSFDDVSVIVKAAVVNTLPVANAGGDKTINLPTSSTTLSGSGSDADGSVVAYQWVKVSGPTVTMGVATNPSLSLSNLVAGIYKFELTVTDNSGGQGVNVATVTVLNANQSPVANAGANLTITLPTNTTNITGSGTDVDGSIASYLWSQTAGPTTATLMNPTIPTLTANDLAEGTYTFMLTVTDDKGATGTDEVDIIVNAIVVNEPPVADAGADKNITLPTSSVTLVGAGSDDDGSIATYEWILVTGPSASLANANTSSLDVSAMVAGTYTFRLTVTDNEGATDSDEVTVSVQPAAVNQSPIVSAGADASITLPTNTLIITGTANDPDGTINSYLWEKVSGPAATLSGAGTITLNLADLLEGTYVFQLTVMDNIGASSSDQVTVVVNSVNQAPVADAGADITINLPINSTSVNGSGTDVDGTIATYAWTQTSGPSTATLTNASTSTLTAADLVVGTYIFTLTVTDNDGATAQDEVKVIVNAANMAPVANAGTNRNITLPTNQATFVGSGTDSDGTIASYQWTQVSGPETAVMTNATTKNLTVTVTMPGTFFFRLTVTDNLGATAFDDARIIVNPATVNQLPTANAGANQSITLPVNTVNLSGTGTDPDGSIATYAWTKISGPFATLSNANTATLSLADMLEGTYTLRLTVTDNSGASASDDVNVTVISAIINQVPVANAGPNQSITLPTNSLNLTGSASDPDGTISTYSWTRISGPTATITNGTSAVVSLSDLLQGTYVFRLTVTDNAGATASDDVTVTVNAVAVNQSPVASAGPDRTITLPTNTITINGSGSDADGSIVTYSWVKTSGPAAALAGNTTPILELSALVEGTYTFRLTVTDNGGKTAQDVMQLIVLPATVNQIPVADAGANQTITLPLNNLTVFGSGSDADGSITTYQWTVVSGTTIVLANETTATVSVTGLAAGSYVLRLTVTDDKGAIDSDDMNITVNALAANQLPVASAGADQTITLPTTITTLNGSGSDPDGTIASYAWVKVSGPAVTTGAANQPSFSLSNLVEGTYVFRLTVQDDDAATDSDDITVTVLPETVNNAPVVSAGADITILEPESLSALDGNASDTDGSIASIAWTQVSGAAAIISNANALFAQVNGLTVGTYRFRLTVTDNDGATAFDEVEITVNPANTNQAPGANAGADKNIKLPTNSVTINGTGTDIDGTIASFAWLKLSGPTVTIAGANTADLGLTNLVEGTYQFQLTVTDDDGASSTDIVVVNVLPATLNEAPVANAGADQSLQLPDNLIVLTGTASDDDGAPTVAWEKISGPAVTMGPLNGLTLQLSNLVAGTYVFRFTATDAQTAKDFDDVILTVFPEPVTPADPVVDLGEDIQIQLPRDNVDILAEASADDGLIVSYSWMQIAGPPVIIDRVDSVVAVIDNMVPGTYAFAVTVTDFGGRTATDEINVTVLEEVPTVRPRSLFSPDNRGDVATETWHIDNADLLNECEINVYNRQGQKVFGSKGYPINWDGTYKNAPVPDGAYFYVITCDGKKTQSGSVTIARLK